MVRQPDRHDVRHRLAALSALDKDELTSIIDGVKKAFESLSPGDILFGDGGFGDLGGLGGFDATGDLPIGGSDADGSNSGSGVDTGAFEPCFDETTSRATRHVSWRGSTMVRSIRASLLPYYRFAGVRRR